jgi:hypothetical protein
MAMLWHCKVAVGSCFFDLESFFFFFFSSRHLTIDQTVKRIVVEKFDRLNCCIDWILERIDSIVR